MSRKPRLTVIALLALSAAPAAASTVSGTITNAQTQSVLSSMVVTAYDTNGLLQGTATSDSAGHYFLQLQAGNYRILTYDPGGVFATVFDGGADSFDAAPLIPVGTGSTILDFALVPGGTITGTVSAVAGSTLEGVTVAAYNLSGTRRGFAQTDPNGVYSIVTPPGQYKVVAYDDAGFFAPRFYPDRYGFDAAQPISVSAGALTSGNNVDLEVAAHLGGTVTDLDTRTSLSGMTVYAYDDAGINVAQATTNDSGLFRMNLPGGSFRLVATDPLLVYATGFFGDTESFDRSLAVSLSPVQSRLDLQVPLHRGGVVRGHVTGASGASLPGIVVAAFNGDGSQRIKTHTDSSGAFTLVLPAQDFRIAAYDEQLVYATGFYNAQSTFQSANDVAVTAGTVAAAVNFALIHAGQISGTITETGTGSPAFDVGVAAYDASGYQVNSTLTSATGAYALALPPGSYKMVCFDAALRYATTYGGGTSNYETASVYAIASDQDQTVNFAVARGILVGGSVVNTTNHPLSGIEIRVLDLAGNRVATTIDSAGGFSFVLLPGSYKLLADDPGGNYSNSYYSGTSTLREATVVSVQAGTAAPFITFVLSNHDRHRAASH